MRTSILQKYFLLAVAIIVMFIFLGFVANNFVIRALLPKREMLPPVFIAKIVDHIDEKNKVSALSQLVSWHDRGPSTMAILVNDQGKVLFPKDAGLDFNWKETVKPEKAYDYVFVKHAEDLAPPDKPPFDFFMGPGRPPGPPPEEGRALIRLKGDPAQYLYFGNPPPPPKDLANSAMSPGFVRFMGISFLIISLLAGVGVTLALIYYSVGKSIRLADTVISELQKGNLKARFPITRHDEFGKAMDRFNQMAEEIEKLVENMKTVEQSRTKLLQELAHDLRTPIASLRNLLETMNHKADRIDVKLRSELMTLSLSEVDYFQRLVEDLLFLAQVHEPKYHHQGKSLNVHEIIEEEGENCITRYQQLNHPISVTWNLAAHLPELTGDVHLLRRLFRNAFENAFSFASHSVQVETLNLGNQIQIQISDDGPGLTPEALAHFGERKFSRHVEDNRKGRLSVGLGSVVMKAISDAHKGQIKIQNILDSQGKILGAQLIITLSV